MCQQLCAVDIRIAAPFYFLFILLSIFQISYNDFASLYQPFLQQEKSSNF